MSSLLSQVNELNQDALDTEKQGKNSIAKYTQVNGLHNYTNDLAEDEVIIVLDFKMKILASMYREKQKDWFSKRGFSCLGALLIFGSSRDSDENEILYHLFLSDDTTQDGVYVNTVKE